MVQQKNGILDSSFDDFLAEKGILEICEEQALKQIFAAPRMLRRSCNVFETGGRVEDAAAPYISSFQFVYCNSSPTRFRFGIGYAVLLDPEP